MVFVLFISSCRKADIKPNQTLNSDYAKDIAMNKASAANQIAKEGGIPQIFTRQQPVTTQWVDQNRNPVTREQMQSNNFVSQCSYNLPAYCNLVQYARVYRCASTSAGAAGYFLQFEYEISWDNNIINDDGGGNKTSGYVDIVDGSNNIVQSLNFDYTNSDVQIVDMGPDPNPSFPNNEIFRVKFVTTDFIKQIVSDIYINSSTYAVKFSAMFVTDCVSGGSPYSLWMLPVTSYGFTGANGDDPCKRNDKAWVTTGPSSGGTMVVCGYSGGFTFTCGYGGSFVAPDLQQVQYNIDGGTWTDMDNYTATGLPIANSAFVRAGDFCQVTGLPSGSHLVGLRYRNWKYGGTTTPWNLPSTGAGDCHSPTNTSLPTTPVDQQFYSTWAYQYWPY